MRVLVTGGAGYIGSHVCKALFQQNFTPITYDNCVYGHEDAVKWGPFVRGDILDSVKVEHVLRDYRVEAVLHFAAFAYVGESITRPDIYYQNNVAGTLSLLSAMRKVGVNTIVASSTCAIFGNPVIQQIHEDHPKDPINPYGASKLMIERILQDFGNAYGLRSICLRYFNAAGADQEGELGEDHDPETHLIPIALDVASGKRPFLTLFGNDYPTPDGTCIRDYIHVTDLADAHIRALKRIQIQDQGHLSASSAFSPLSSPLTPSHSLAFNLANGKGFSVQEVVASVERVTGRRVPVTVGPRRPGDPAVLVGDSARATRELGWIPRFQELDSIIETAWKWHRSRA